jgi:hypothetical protein
MRFEMCDKRESGDRRQESGRQVKSKDFTNNIIINLKMK